MSTHNICFHGEIMKISILKFLVGKSTLSGAMNDKYFFQLYTCI